MSDIIAAPAYLTAAAAAIWDELVESGVKPGPGLDSYCNQMAIERDCAARIAVEGLIVADSKGNPVPHVALEIQRKAQAEIRLWAGKFPRRLR